METVAITAPNSTFQSDLDNANNVISATLTKLKESYNLSGIGFTLTDFSPNFIGVTIDIDSPAFKAYFNSL